MFVCRSLLSFAGGRMKGCSKDPNLLLVIEMPFVKRFILFFLLSMFWHCKDPNVLLVIVMPFVKRFISFFLLSMFWHYKDPNVLLVISSVIQVGEGDYQEEYAQ